MNLEDDKRKIVLTITIASSEQNDTRNKFAIIIEVRIIRAWEKEAHLQYLK